MFVSTDVIQTGKLYFHIIYFVVGVVCLFVVAVAVLIIVVIVIVIIIIIIIIIQLV